MNYKTTRFKVTGMQYYEKDFFGKLAYENSDFDLKPSELADMYDIGDRIYQYCFNDVNAALVPEPENEADPNAVRVDVNGVKIGYIKRGACSQVKNLLNSPDFMDVKVTMGGGKYKRLYEDSETDKIKIEHDSCGYFADVEIRRRTEDESPLSSITSPPTAPVSSSSLSAPSPAVTHGKKKGGAASVVLIVLGILFLVGGVNGFSIAVSNGIIGLLIGGVCLYFGIKRRKSNKS